MSFSDTINAAATAAQSTLAQIQGMAPGGVNTILPGGQKVVMTYGTPQTIWVPAAGGGYRKKHTLIAVLTRDQVAAAPPDQAKIERTDIVPNIAYIVDYVNRDGPIAYELHLARFGEKP